MATLSTCGDSQRCTPWKEVECTCEGGEKGARLCLASGDFDECFCAGDRSWHDGLDAGAGDGAWGGVDFEEDVSFDAGAIDGQLLLAGAEKLLDVFARGDNVWVILENRVVRINLASGAELASWSARQPISATAFDGERLVMLEGARLTLLDPDALTPQRSLDLIAPCTSVALMSAGPLACSAGAALHVVDLTTGAQHSLSRGVYTGVLREVPGARRFVTTDVSSTSSAHVFDLGADGRLAGRPVFNPSVAKAEELSGPAAFDRRPSQNVVTKTGLLLRMDGTCGPSANSCLLRTGSLELFGPVQRFVAMDTADNQLFGLLDGPPDPFSKRPRCYAKPCSLMRIDVNARKLIAEQTVARPLGSVVALRALPEHGAVVLGLVSSLLGTFAPSIPGGFEVVRLELPRQ
jgi:hypothetical protein